MSARIKPAYPVECVHEETLTGVCIMSRASLALSHVAGTNPLENLGRIQYIKAIKEIHASANQPITPL